MIIIKRSHKHRHLDDAGCESCFCPLLCGKLSAMLVTKEQRQKTPVSSMSPLSCEHIPFCPRLFHMNGTKSTSFSETGLTIAVILALMLKDICIFLWALLCQNSHIRSPGNESMLESAITLFANHHGNQKEKRPTALALQIYNRPQSTGFGGNQ